MEVAQLAYEALLYFLEPIFIWSLSEKSGRSGTELLLDRRCDGKFHLGQVRECVVSLLLVKAERPFVAETTVPMSLSFRSWHFTNPIEHLHIEQLGRKRKLFVSNELGRAKALI